MSRPRKSGFRPLSDGLSIPPVKVFFLLLALLPGVSSAATAEPSSAALEFLEKVRLGSVNLEPGQDTALSTHTSPEKRKQISRRLERLADDLGKGRLETAEVKIDGDFAAVIVRNASGFDPSRVRVLAIGLVKIRNLWLPAPVPSSFENTGAGLVTAARQRVNLLENWMLRGQAAELAHLRDKSRERMQRDIRKAIDPKLLSSASPEKVAAEFLTACRNHQLPAILGFLGGLQETPPDDWADRLRSADAAMTAGKKAGWPWRLLMAPEVARVPVSDGGETTGSLFSFACLDPAGRGTRLSPPKVEILHIELSRSQEGLWQVDLPPSFLLAPGEEEDEAEDDFPQALLDAFPGEIRKQIQVKPAESIAAAAAAVQEALKADSLTPLFALMDLEGDPGTASRGCALAAKAWWQLHNPEAPRLPVPLGFHENGRAGIATFQFFSPREPAALDLKTFYFEKSKSGWLLMPGLKPTNSPSESQIAVREWVADRDKTWRLTWQTKLLADSQRLDSIAEGNAPSEEEARKLVTDWLKATHEADMAAALEMLVTINRQGETARTLQNLGFEIGTALRDEGKASIIHCGRGATWTAVGVKSQAGKSATFPLYLVVATKAGPRLLIAADLFGDPTSGRDKLNEGVLKRMNEFTAPASMGELRALFDKFRQGVREGAF